MNDCYHKTIQLISVISVSITSVFSVLYKFKEKDRTEVIGFEIKDNRINDKSQ